MRSITAASASKACAFSSLYSCLSYTPRTPGIAGLSEDHLRPSPDIGQDSYEVLLQAGFDRNAIDDLVRAGAVRQAKGAGA